MSVVFFAVQSQIALMDADTMAVIPGHISDEVLVIGNHRDGTST